MIRRLSSLLLGVFLFSAVASGQVAKPDASADVSDELAKLNKSVREIADLLAKYAEGQKVSLLMKRAELGAANVARLEERLRSLRSEKNNAEDEKQKLESELDAIRGQADSPQFENRRQEVQAYIARGEANAKRLTSRIQAIDAEIGEVEATMTKEREELRQLERQLYRGLTGF